MLVEDQILAKQDYRENVSSWQRKDKPAVNGTLLPIQSYNILLVSKGHYTIIGRVREGGE